MALMLTVMAVWLQATPLYRTQLLQQIAQKSGITVPNTIAPDTRIDSLGVVGGHCLYLRTDGLGDVAHIGYSLFSQQLLDNRDHRTLLEFVERYLLELDLRISELSMQKRMDVDRVVITEGSWDNVRKLTPASDISVSIVEILRHLKRLTIDAGGRRTSITIPIDCQLLLGANAIELEQMAISTLHRIKPVSDDPEAAGRWMDMKRKSFGKFEIVEGGHYIINEICGDIYLSSKNGKLQPICSPESPARSVSNIMLTGHAPKELLMSLEVNQYGFKSEFIDMVLPQLIAFCMDEGCKLYFGVKTRSADTITGTLFAYNQQLAYTHMVAVDFPLSILDDGSGIIKGRAYLYIPIQNIPDKFFEQDFKPIRE